MKTPKFGLIPIALDASHVKPRASSPAGVVASTDAGTELVEPLIMQLSPFEAKAGRIHSITNHIAVFRDTLDMPDGPFYRFIL